MAGVGTNIWPAFTTRKHAQEKGKSTVVHASHRTAETFMHVCRRPTEAALFRVQKCANNHQPIFSGIERFLRHACAAHFRVIYIHAKRREHYVYTQTVIGVFFVDGNGNMHACLTG